MNHLSAAATRDAPDSQPAAARHSVRISALVRFIVSTVAIVVARAQGRAALSMYDSRQPVKKRIAVLEMLTLIDLDDFKTINDGYGPRAPCPRRCPAMMPKVASTGARSYSPGGVRHRDHKSIIYRL